MSFYSFQSTFISGNVIFFWGSCIILSLDFTFKCFIFYFNYEKLRVKLQVDPKDTENYCFKCWFFANICCSPICPIQIKMYFSMLRQEKNASLHHSLLAEYFFVCLFCFKWNLFPLMDMDEKESLSRTQWSAVKWHKYFQAYSFKIYFFFFGHISLIMLFPT